MKILVTLILSFSSIARADIVGGVDITPSDPIQTSVTALYKPSPDGQGGALCTASLIGTHTAVTAAHCVSPRGPKPVLIFGNDVRSQERELRPVAEVAVNPRWAAHQGKGMDQGDIALVKFRGNAPEEYHPIPMLTSDRTLKRGESVTLAGYGISDAQRKTGAGILRKTRVTIDGPRPGKTEMILDQSAGHGACHGDSGGPAFVRQGGKMILAGVTNRGYPSSAPDDCKHKVVYTKVSSYAPWINSTERRFEGSGQGAQRSLTAADGALHAAKSRIGRRLPMGAGALSQISKKTTHRGRKPSSHTRRNRHPS